jgi:bacterial/archaeal transporter family protein
MPSWMIYAALSAVFAAATAVLIKLGTQTIDSDVATFYRTIIIFCVSLAIIAIKSKKLTLAESGTREVTFLALSGVATGLSWLCYFRAMKDGPIGHVSLIDKSSVLLVVLAGVLFFGEQLSAKSGIGIALVIAGLYFLSLR